jgi:hypothetical protein
MDTDKYRECGICYLELPLEKIVNCVKCNFECCKECWKKYILEGLSSGLVPEISVVCMNCKNPFTKNFLLDIGGRVWLTRDIKNTYKFFLKNIYAEKEKAKIPETIIYIGETAKKEKIYQEITDLLNSETNKKYEEKLKNVRKLLGKVMRIIIYKYQSNSDNLIRFCYAMSIFRDYPESIDFDAFERLKTYLPIDFMPFFTKELQNKQISKYLDEIKKIKSSEEYKNGIETNGQIQELEYKLKILRNKKEDDVPTVQFIQGCPFGDCKGLIDSEKFMCSICFGRVCKKCRISIQPSSSGSKKHKCKPEDIESVKLIKTDTKACPKCSTNIYRISGCFAKNTKILMYDGTTKLSQDISVGDVLVGDDGTERVVEELCTGIDDMYKIVQNTAEDYIVSSKHTLVFANTKNELQYILAEDFYNSEKLQKSDLYGIKCSYGVDYNKTSIKIEYVGKDKYYGWRVNKNNLFLLNDLTVVKNCTQIWCTQCHVAFDWVTGKIETGTIHNPHYIEFIRNRGLTLHDNNECGDDIPHQARIFERLSTPRFIGDGSPPLNFILIDYHIISMVSNLIQDLLPHYIRPYNGLISEDYDDERSFSFRLRKYRADYIQNKISEKEWKKRIYEIYKHIELKKFYIEVFNSLRMVLMESYKKLYVDLQKPEHVFSDREMYDKYVKEKTNIHDTFINYVEDARNYFNDSIINEHSLYSTSMDFMFIGPLWDIMKYIDYKKYGLQRPSYMKDDMGMEKSYQISSRRVHDNYDIYMMNMRRQLTAKDSEEEIYVVFDSENENSIEMEEEIVDEEEFILEEDD